MASNHGHTRGRVQTPEYSAWLNMVERCRNPKKDRYPRYGGRGIVVCQRWQTFVNFLEDMGPRPSPTHSIERIDTDGNYEPKNCRWATRAEQARNTTRTKLITRDGVTKCVTDWCHELGVNVSTALRRLREGVPAERIFVPPTTKLDAEKAASIRALHASGETPATIADRYGVTRPLIYAVLKGRCYATAKENA